MLKIKEVLNFESAYIQNMEDEYIPFKLVGKDFESQLGKILYWSIASKAGSLIEIGINEITGRIEDITCTTLSKIDYKADGFVIKNQLKEGCQTPIVDTAIWKKSNENYIRVEGIILYNLFENNFSLDFSGEVVTKVIRLSNNFFIGFNNKSEIVNLKILDLNEMQVKNFIEIIRSS
ncbi:hypothetical protein RCC89_19445 [Cytophagaceae bacterium ABcell3]|nr:hypothetical protein RCC89_19445 [Cytophagaceae bacterium ABcell3]